ncbi:MAG: MFS transporter [Acidimicrobiia bacterium]
MGRLAREAGRFCIDIVTNLAGETSGTMPGVDDVRRILLAQGLRAFGYGLGAVLLGASLEAAGRTPGEVGLLLAALVAGSALASLAVAALGDRWGRRSWYMGLFLALAVAGGVFGLSDDLWLLALVGLTGAVSTEVVESGPFTSLEQSMLSARLDGSGRTRAFGAYNAVATVAGSVGALAAGGPGLLGATWELDRTAVLVLVPIGLAGAALAWSLSARVEEAQVRGARRNPLSRSRHRVLGLSGLFALDSFGGGFVVQTYVAYWFSLRFGASLETLGVVFFAVGILQSVSFLVATRIADRIGLLNTMIFTHLPSNLLLAAIPLAPSFPLAVGLLLGRFALSQMDVPTRQAYVMALVGPQERTAAAAYTNTARYLVRPLGPVVAGVLQQVALGLPFFLAGGIKAVYDLALWAWFRRVPIDEQR